MKLRKVIGAFILTIALFNIGAPTVLSQTQTAQLPPTQCFKKEECGQGKYVNSFAVAAPECAPYPPYTHYCVSNPPAVKLSIPLGGKDEIQGLQNYIATIYKLLIGLAGILAGIMITVAGFQWLTAAGDSGKIKAARSKIMNALIGLVLALGAYTILYTINPALLSLQLAPIKIIREDGISTGVWSECNTNQDCLPLQSRQVLCGLTSGLITEGQRNLTIPRLCQPKPPGSNTNGFSGSCVIQQNHVCRIEDYSCTNYLQTASLAAAAFAITATGGAAAIGATSGIGAGAGAIIGASAAGGTGLAGVTTTGAIMKSVLSITAGVIEGVTENTASGGFDASFSCQSGTSCQQDPNDKKLVGAQDSISTDPDKYKCLPTKPGAICRDDSQCPSGYHCTQSVPGDLGICLNRPSYHTKEIGQSCVYQQDCKSDRCGGGICVGNTRDTKRPPGSACTSSQDCQGGFCIGYRDSNNYSAANPMNMTGATCQPTQKDPQKGNLDKIITGGFCDTGADCITGTTCQEVTLDNPNGGRRPTSGRYSLGAINKQCK